MVNGPLFKQYDALICPGCLAPAPRFSDFPIDFRPLPPKLVTAVRTMPFNVTGNPALAIPIGFSASGLPLGMQIVGRAFDEPTVFRIGAAYEAAIGLIQKRPHLESVSRG